MIHLYVSFVIKHLSLFVQRTESLFRRFEKSGKLKAQPKELIGLVESVDGGRQRKQKTHT